MVTTLALLALLGAQSDGISMKYIDSGVTARLRAYRPLRAELTDKADAVKKAPEGLAAPKYGTLKIGTQEWAVILDEPEGKPAKLYVDTNGDGDLTNDPETSWSAEQNGDQTMHQGNAKVELGDGKIGSLGLYRFDPQDKLRPQLKNTLLFYTDFGYEVTINLDGKTYTSFVSGLPDASSRFAIDRDGNGKVSAKLETIQVEKPFNFTGTTYVLKVTGNELKLEKATEEVPLTPLPPDLSIGKKAPPFKMTALDGTEIDFPKTYAGQLVMLDFWATWCGPCIAELPNVKKAYENWHDDGFDVLGISFDAQNMEEKLKAFTKERDMPWKQIYEGKMWDTTLGELYDVSGIPFVLLVDGDTGEILATARQLRGPGLSDFIEKALEQKGKKPTKTAETAEAPNAP